MLTPRELLSAWDVGEVVSAMPIRSYSGGATEVSVVSGERYVLKRRSTPADVDREIDLLTSLKESGVPVAIPVRTKTGDPCLVSEDNPYCLYPRLRGTVIREHYGRGAPGRARRFGRAIARLHEALREWRPGVNLAGLDLVAHVRDWALPAIGRHPDQIGCGRVATIGKEYLAELGPLVTELPMQWIHRDIHPENMLFAGGELTGIIDFEMVRRGPRLFDPCYCATSILIGGWQDPRNRMAWPGLLKELISGYEETIPLTQPEQKAIFSVLCGIEFIFMAFCLEHERYGSARCNQVVLFWLHDSRTTIGL